MAFIYLLTGKIFLFLYIRIFLILFICRSIIVVADGCNWGERPKRAAERARNSVMGYLKEKNPKIKTVNDAKLYLLRSFNDAHNRICEKHHPDEVIHFFSLHF